MHVHADNVEVWHDFEFRKTHIYHQSFQRVLYCMVDHESSSLNI